MPSVRDMAIDRDVTRQEKHFFLLFQLFLCLCSFLSSYVEKKCLGQWRIGLRLDRFFDPPLSENLLVHSEHVRWVHDSLLWEARSRSPWHDSYGHYLDRAIKCASLYVWPNGSISGATLTCMQFLFFFLHSKTRDTSVLHLRQPWQHNFWKGNVFQMRIVLLDLVPILSIELATCLVDSIHFDYLGSPNLRNNTEPFFSWSANERPG